MKVRGVLSDIAKALNRLDRSAGRIARRNARAELARVVRKLRADVDREFPAIKLGPRPRRSIAHLTLTQRHSIRQQKLKRAGWVPMGSRSFHIGSYQALALFSSAGVRAKVIEFGGMREIWIPEWAAEIGPNPEKLRRAMRSPSDMAALRAEAALMKRGSTTNEEGN